MTATPEADDDPLIGTEISGYRVESAIGRGGMGSVYRAVQPASDAEVAIKVLAHDLVGDRDSCERFVNEARIANRVRHEGLVKVLFIGMLPDDRPYLIMEHLTGAPLSSLIGHAMPRGTLLERLAEAARAIGAMHDAGVIHRDLKPANLFVTTAGFIKVLDFGIAKLAEERSGLTRTGHSIGTPGYMSPEQANAETLDHRSDIYSLGVVLFEAIAGERPFEGRVVEALVAGDAPPAIDPDLDPVIGRAMAHDRARRFASMEDFAAALDAIVAGLPRDVFGPLIDAPVRPSKPASRDEDRSPPTVNLRSSDSAIQPPTALEKPRKLGRYLVEGTAGRGGEGVVLIGVDPKVQRKVALKLLDAGTGDRRERIVAEAQAMARVSHPNVVTLYELGEDGDQLFLAMEYLEGTDLERWLVAERRGWRAIVAMFAAAGEGLAAAHDVGVVHRDFKPANVLLGKDGRPRVGDFGIAEVGGNSGEVAGTVAFMPPEQLEGMIDPRSDQFAFCASLWRALHGEAPYAGTTAVAMALAAQRGELRDPALPVSAAVTRALRRGLAASPDARFPDMRALLAELRAAPVRARGRTIAIGAAAAAVAGLGFYVASRSREPEPAVHEVTLDELRALDPTARLAAIEKLPSARLDDPELRWLARDAVTDGLVRRIALDVDPVDRAAAFSSTGKLLVVPAASSILLIDQRGAQTVLAGPPGVPSRVFLDDATGQLRALVGDEVLATAVSPVRWTSVARCVYQGSDGGRAEVSPDLSMLACVGVRGGLKVDGADRGLVLERDDTIAFAPTARRVVVRRDAAVELYDVGAPKARLIGTQPVAGGGAIAVSDRLVAFARDDRTVVWDPDSGATATVPGGKSLALTGGSEPVLIVTDGAQSRLIHLSDPLALAAIDPFRPVVAQAAGRRVIEQARGDVVVRDYVSGVAWRQRGASTSVAVDREGAAIALFDGRALRLWTLNGPTPVSLRLGSFTLASDRALITRRFGAGGTETRIFDLAGATLGSIPGKLVDGYYTVAFVRDGKTEVWHRDRGFEQIFDRETSGVVEHAGSYYANIDSSFTRLADRAAICGGNAAQASRDGSTLLVFQSSAIVACRLPAGTTAPLELSFELAADARTKEGRTDSVTWRISDDGSTITALHGGLLSRYDATTGARLPLPPALAKLRIDRFEVAGRGLVLASREGVFELSGDQVTQHALPGTYEDLWGSGGAVVVLAGGRVTLWNRLVAHDLGMLASTLPKNHLSVVGDSVIAYDLDGAIVIWSLAPPAISEIDRWLAAL